VVTTSDRERSTAPHELVATHERVDLHEPVGLHAGRPPRRSASTLAGLRAPAPRRV